MNWEELGFELAGTAENGKEAVRMVESMQIDVVLTDICMPYMDGLELSKYLYEHHPETKIIIFSGYSDFDYARKAIEYDVSEYILKPITARELGEVLTKVRGKLDEISKDEKKMSELSKAYHAYAKNEASMAAKSLMKLVKGTQSVEDARIDLKEMDIELHTGCYRVAVIDIDEEIQNGYTDDDGDEAHKKESALMAFVVLNIAGEIMKKRQAGLAFQDTDNRTYLLLYTNEVKEHLGSIADVCSELKTTIYQTTKLSITIGIGGYVENLSSLPSSFACAKRLLSLKYHRGNGNTFWCDKLSDSLREGISISAVYTEDITDGIRKKNKRQIDQTLDKLHVFLAESTPEKSDIVSYLHMLQSAVCDTVREVNAAFRLKKSDVLAISEAASLKRAMQLIDEYIREGFSVVQEAGQSVKDRQTMLARDYLSKNYMNPELTLNDVCRHLGISSSYFSLLFKEATGRTFVETLTELRIAKAKELLSRTTLKSYEIAEKVGFLDPHYFTVTFKKLVGITPKRYAADKKAEDV